MPPKPSTTTKSTIIKYKTKEAEYGVRFEDGFVYICEDERDAHASRQVTGGEIVTREVMFTAWKPVTAGE